MILLLSIFAYNKVRRKQVKTIGGVVMKKVVVHLYQKIGRNNRFESNISNGYFDLSPLPVAGIVSSNDITLPSRKSLVSHLKLRPFEILQEHFITFLKAASSFGVQILNIEFTINIDEEIDEEINEHLKNKQFDKVISLIKELSFDGVEIFAISFVYKGNRYKMSKYAVAELNSPWESIPEEIVNTPISIIAGIKKFSAFDLLGGGE